MFCRECGKMIQEGSKFCIGCGTKVEPITMKNNVVREKEEIKEKVNLEQEVNTNDKTTTVVDSSTNAINYGNKNNVSNQVNANDKRSIGLNIVSFLVPLVGLILFLVMKKETPKKAKAIGISALVGYILSIVVSVVFCIYIYGFVMPEIRKEIYYPQYNKHYDYYIDRDYNI